MAEPKQAPIAATQAITISLDANNKVQVDNPYLKIQSTDSIQFTNNCSGSTVKVHFIGRGNAVFSDVKDLPYPDTSPAQSPKSNNVIANYTVSVTAGPETNVGGPFCIEAGTGPLPVELHFDQADGWQADPPKGQIPGIGDTVQFTNRDKNNNCEVKFDGGFSPLNLTVGSNGGQQQTEAVGPGVWRYETSTPSARQRIMLGGGTVGVGGGGAGGPGGGKKR